MFTGVVGGPKRKVRSNGWEFDRKTLASNRNYPLNEGVSEWSLGSGAALVIQRGQQEELFLL